MRDWWRLHKGSVAWLALVVLAGLGWLKIEAIANSTHDALCTQRTNLVQRIQGSREYLADHPHGAPGISRATIEASIQRDQTAVDAFETLDC